MDSRRSSEIWWFLRIQLFSCGGLCQKHMTLNWCLKQFLSEDSIDKQGGKKKIEWIDCRETSTGNMITPPIIFCLAPAKSTIPNPHRYIMIYPYPWFIPSSESLTSSAYAKEKTKFKPQIVMNSSFPDILHHLVAIDKEVACPTFPPHL